MLTEVADQLSFFLELAMVLVAATIGAVVARLLKQPAILGYIFGGLLISPFTIGPSIHDIHNFDELAEVGIILLMFSIGAEFSPRELSSVKKLALIGGPLGVLLIVGMGGVAGWLLGWPWTMGVAMGAIISAASTMVLGRLLIDRGELRSPTGKITIGLSLIDDMAVVIMIVLLPVLATLRPETVGNLGFELGRAFLILAPAVFLSAKAIPWLLRRISGWNNHELLFISTMALSVGAAAFTEWLGLSLALGAFLAGVLLSNSEEGRRAVAQLHGFRDLCVAIFFVSVGALIDPRQILSNLELLAVLLALILGGKTLVWFGIVFFSGSNWRTALRSAIYLSQIGEFSFLLSTVALGAGLITPALANAVLAAALLSILANSFLTKLIKD
jgi:CPA2 family monovalent cation:H+ antiporter-2